MSRIAAKPTIYRGVRFRSRLEARWAVFFDAIGREWIYEPSFPELASIGYQPDFLLEDHLGGTTVHEIKPLVGGWENLASLANELTADTRYQQTASILQTRLILTLGAPGVWEQGRLTDIGHCSLMWYPTRQSPDLYEWAECLKCSRIALWMDGYPRCCTRPLPSGLLYDAYATVRDQSYEDVR